MSSPTRPMETHATSFWRRISSRHARSATMMPDARRVEETAEVESNSVKSTIPTHERQLPRLQPCSPAQEDHPKGFHWRRLHFLHHSGSLRRRLSCPDDLAALDEHPSEDDACSTEYDYPGKSTSENLADGATNAFKNRLVSPTRRRRKRSCRSWLFPRARSLADPTLPGDRACPSSLSAWPPSCPTKFCSRHHTRQTEPSEALSSPCGSWSNSSQSSPSVSPQNSVLFADNVTPRKLDLCHRNRPSSPLCKPASYPYATVPPNPEILGVNESSTDVSIYGVDISVLHLLLASFLGCIAIFPPKHLMVLPVIWRSFIGASLIVVSLASLLLLLCKGQTAAAGERKSSPQEPCSVDGSKAIAVKEIQSSSINGVVVFGFNTLECCEGLDLFAVPVLLAVFGVSVMANSDPSRVALILLLLGLLVKGVGLLLKGVAAFSTKKIGTKPAWWLWVAKLLKAREEWEKLRFGIH